MMWTTTYDNLILVDGNGDGIVDIHDSRDAIYDSDSGLPITASQLAKVSDDRFYLVDEDGRWIGEQSQNPSGVAMGFLASPPPVQTTSSKMTATRGVGIVAGAATLLWIGWETFSDTEGEDLELNSGIRALPSQEYYIISANSEEDVAVQEVDDDSGGETETEFTEDTMVSPEDFIPGAMRLDLPWEEAVTIRDLIFLLLGRGDDFMEKHYFRKAEQCYRIIADLYALVGDESKEFHYRKQTLLVENAHIPYDPLKFRVQAAYAGACEAMILEGDGKFRKAAKKYKTARDNALLGNDPELAGRLEEHRVRAEKLAEENPTAFERALQRVLKSILPEEPVQED